MNITINKLELAAELAHSRVVDHFKGDDEEIYKDQTAEVLEYSEEAQEVFIEYYEYYGDLIESCETKK